MYERLKKELIDYYFGGLTDTALRIKSEVFSEMDDYAEKNKDASAFALKAKLYDVIADRIEPKVFDELPFLFETGVLVAQSDGRYRHGGSILHANAWLYERNSHLFKDIDPDMYELYRQDKNHQLYSETGMYVDIMHMGLPLKKVFSVGLSGVIEELNSALQTAEGETKEFLECAVSGILTLRKIENKLADAAKRAGRPELAEVARRVPWETPKSFYEGLFAMAFMRRAFGSLEGVGYNSFGRVDLLLKDLYEADKARGVKDAELYDYVAKFLLIWDSALDRTITLKATIDHELENTLTLGGTDENGEPVYNGVTRLFLDARDNLCLLYPKMMLRYSSSSPREYLERIAEPLLKSRSQSLIENDEVAIPALIASGVSERDAVNYVVGGCWDLLTHESSIRFSGEYFNLILPLAWSVHRENELLAKHELNFKPLEDSDSFEELYLTYLGYIREILERKARSTSIGAREWHKVNPVPILSALMETPIAKGRDLTAGGGKYNWEQVYFSFFADTVDSLLAIKHLCFDKKICTLRELFDECRADWRNEVLRQRAIHAPSYGDGSEESSRLAGRLFDDLYEMSRGLPTAYGGKYRVGYNQYVEIVFWGEVTKALPSGRRGKENLSAGLTHSRVQSGVTFADAIDSLRYIDTNKCAGNSGLTVTLPAGRISLDSFVELLYALAGTPAEALQINCLDAKTLRAAQKEPEKYGDIIVRVCGFSAPFVQLSSSYQEEVVSRMVTEA